MSVASGSILTVKVLMPFFFNFISMFFNQFSNFVQLVTAKPARPRQFEWD